jgi:hypothetical protein
MRTLAIIAAIALATTASADIWAARFGATFTPLTLGSKLAVWFDASDPATVLDAGGNVATNGAFVQTWSDKSGNARHATAPAEAQRPRMFAGIQNGRAVLRTDGGDFMILTNSLSVFRNKSAGYIFMIAKDANQADGDGTHAGITWRFDTQVLHGLYSRSVAGNGWGARGRRLLFDTLANTATTIVSGHNLIVGFADWSGGAVKQSINASAYAAANYSSGAGASQDADCSNVYMFGFAANVMPADSEIAEVVVVNAAMTDAEITSLQNYLKAKWGTP